MGPSDFSGRKVTGDFGKGSLAEAGFREDRDGGGGKAKASLLRCFSIMGSRIKGATMGEVCAMKRRSEEPRKSRAAHEEGATEGREALTVQQRAGMVPEEAGAGDQHVRGAGLRPHRELFSTPGKGRRARGCRQQAGGFGWKKR